MRVHVCYIGTDQTVNHKLYSESNPGAICRVGYDHYTILLFFLCFLNQPSVCIFDFIRTLNGLNAAFRLHVPYQGFEPYNLGVSKQLADP